MRSAITPDDQEALEYDHSRPRHHLRALPDLVIDYVITAAAGTRAAERYGLSATHEMATSTLDRLAIVSQGLQQSLKPMRPQSRVMARSSATSEPSRSTSSPSPSLPGKRGSHVSNTPAVRRNRQRSLAPASVIAALGRRYKYFSFLDPRSNLFFLRHRMPHGCLCCCCLLLLASAFCVCFLRVPFGL